MKFAVKTKQYLYDVYQNILKGSQEILEAIQNKLSEKIAKVLSRKIRGNLF